MTSATVVLIRTWRKEGSEPIAIFPYIPAATTPGVCLTYERVGQHGSGSPGLLAAHTRPATSAEEAAMLRQLRQQGYESLRVVRRMPKHRAMYDAHKAEIAR